MFSKKVLNNLNNSSWIRLMFEEGAKLEKKYGKDKVYDYSLGNPYAEPPFEVLNSLKNHVSGNEQGLHRYMSNAGYPEVREKIAEQLQKNSNIKLSTEHIVMTVGAAGGLNVVLKSILNPEEEVILFAPYFAEYNFYIDNHGGKTIIVPPDTSTFEPDLIYFEKSITPKTKAIIINNPNNPTGVIYNEKTLKNIQDIIFKKEQEFGITIFIISDQPYSEIIYDNTKLPNILSIFKNAIIVNSFSKSLGLAGERIGYIAVSSKIENVPTLINALSFCNRTLGFVNAPALFQKVIADSLDAKVDISAYEERRNFLYEHLTKLGFQCVKPQGAFYLFPKALIDDDVKFIKEAMKYNLLLVPGSGFGCPGYFRISYCVEFDMIKNSIAAFEKLANEFIK
ncbi:aspartate aminotransferase [Clostridium botulinum]|uniref:Aminotransferase n=1 Tax=Clostridium botulinum TaxID=1491 RepID=A0A9Q1ZAX5_CLOBO|nr:pyridoxal phosphate-dependent aminotransferase [Clostridium botulinum]AEB76707.1 aspartate aminotransferase [Clostridium botulinum BKT015925]KEI00167.1 aspartate aminotransferase [Clostridium botulinum D str. 16868]KEI01630.1 aspartate aminotransferase [Clostridium botulinum C/D str. Sp77]KOA80763.1 aspartate aminotransferase [Clostridium botulinum]KOA82778.1 aspartate aminotransferase [Clostridium botulinum]